MCPLSFESFPPGRRPQLVPERRYWNFRSSRTSVVVECPQVRAALFFSWSERCSNRAAAMARSNVEEPQNRLERLAIFAGLPQEALERIRRRCRWRRYEPGEPIVDYLDASDDVFFVAAGEARVTIYSLAGKAVSFRDLGPGDVFGEYPAIDGGPRSGSVEARTSCLVASMSAAAFKELLQVEPAVSVVKVSRTVEVVN
jgi:hypothetical protein